jgi:hypothetical protein
VESLEEFIRDAAVETNGEGKKKIHKNELCK